MAVDNRKRSGAGRLGGVSIAQLLRQREVSLLILLVLCTLVLSMLTSSFATPGNIRVLLQGMAVDMIIAVPMAISLIAGNIDFSVGSIVALTSTVAGIALASGIPPAGAILIALALGAILGLINAVLVDMFRITALVATLGTWMAYKGLALVVAGGQTIGNFPEGFTVFGRLEPLGIPISIIYMVTVILAGIFVMKYGRFFNNAYFIGSNRESARLAGINISRFTYNSFMLTGVLSAFAGVVLAARLGAASQQAGDGLEFRDVVGLLIGGISMNGGVGSIMGAVLGVALMQLVNNAIVLLHLNVSYTKVITGAILILAVAVDQLAKTRRRRRAVESTPDAARPKGGGVHSGGHEDGAATAEGSDLSRQSQHGRPSGARGGVRFGP